MATPNLALTHIAAAQNQKEVTANAAFDGLDLALTNVVTENVPDAAFVLPQADALGNMAFVFVGSLTATRGVTLPPTKKMYLVSNQTTGSPQSSLQFGIASSPTGRTASIPPGKASDWAVLYCDGVNVDIVAAGGASEGADLFSIGLFFPGTLSNGQVMLYLPFDRPALLQAFAPKSYANAKAAATGTAVINLTRWRSGVAALFATITFSASGTLGAFSQAGDLFLLPGDILEIDGPATADATLANIGITLQAVRF